LLFLTKTNNFITGTTIVAAVLTFAVV